LVYRSIHYIIEWADERADERACDIKVQIKSSFMFHLRLNQNKSNTTSVRKNELRLRTPYTW